MDTADTGAGTKMMNKGKGCYPVSWFFLSLLAALGLATSDAVKKGSVYYTSESLYRLTPKAISGIEEIAGYLDRYED